jgi:hypothetical protein
MRTAIPVTVLATALACSLATAPAHARARVFVASYGNDSNPCTFGSPCKTFQQAVNAVDAGGEVSAIDSAGFGPILITKAVTITSPNGVEAGIVPVSGGNSITINAGPNDAVHLQGLHIDGGGVGSNGIVFNSGSDLTVADCVVQNFVGAFPNGNGIWMQPTSGTTNFAITNSTSSNNVNGGIIYRPLSGSPSASGVIDHVITTANSSVGIDVDTVSTAGGSTSVTISNSIASNNGFAGIVATTLSSPLLVSIDAISASGNNTGVVGDSFVKVLLGRSVIMGNGTGVDNTTTVNTFFSYKDNRITGNTNSDISHPLNTTVALQ